VEPIRELAEQDINAPERTLRLRDRPARSRAQQRRSHAGEPDHEDRNTSGADAGGGDTRDG
jgi:hypothetical protein